MNIRIITILLTLTVLPLSAFADEEENSCGISSCDAGQRLVSYSDGNSADCHCVPEANMDETVVEGVEGEDPDNYD